MSFDLAGETVKTLKDKQPELFKSGQGKRFMLLGAEGEKATKGGTGLMLSLVEFDREKAIASLVEGKPVIPVWLDVIYQLLTIKLAD
ncbi:MAG TPA: hypothetical protein DCL61_04810 [Cyanobacteria bacterium UBA12227]|nr:hypothetical protein [Cyanobacteria bacterium UBA12227]HAX89162.1 hypothetical protein [Cyanobacteria bacterium UBA11370]HBY75704.1 hypothetical protein [Cyanobacteria bacterium UBA11148]